MEQKLSDTLVKAIDRSNPMMQNLQLASRFNKLIEEGGGSADLEDNKEISITENGTVEITPAEGKDGMKKVTATVNVSSGGGGDALYCWKILADVYPTGKYIYTNYDKTPDASAFLLSKCINNIGESAVIQGVYSATEVLKEKISDTEFTTDLDGLISTFKRHLTGDFTGWN